LESVDSITFKYLEKLKLSHNSHAKDLRTIVAKVKNISSERALLCGNEIFLTDEEVKMFQSYLDRYANGEPLSKIINCKPFWKYEFFVNADVLDPRSETELLIETILSNFALGSPIKFLDIGTGSGCILISLLLEFKNASGIGIDASKKAIDVARYNQSKLCPQSNFLNIDWNDFSSKEKFDVIVSNPPYVRSEDIEKLDKSVRNYDPSISLDGGEDGLKAYGEISSLARKLLKPKGTVLYEVGSAQSQDVVNILMINGFTVKNILKDLNGINRVVLAVLDR
jgi:release factor glutamine methyltransferase